MCPAGEKIPPDIFKTIQHNDNIQIGSLQSEYYFVAINYDTESVLIPSVTSHEKLRLSNRIEYISFWTGIFLVQTTMRK